VGSFLKFFAIAYTMTWAFFISVAAMPVPAPYRGLLALLGAFAPAVAAVSLTARDEGDSGVRVLVGRVAQWRTAAPWYLFAVGYMAAMKLAVAGIHRVFTGA
jgi:hypothetical protein